MDCSPGPSDTSQPCDAPRADSRIDTAKAGQNHDALRTSYRSIRGWPRRASRGTSRRTRSAIIIAPLANPLTTIMPTPVPTAQISRFDGRHTTARTSTNTPITKTSPPSAGR